MSSDGASSVSGGDVCFVRLARPHRRVSTGIVVAGRDGLGVHLPATAARVWELLATPATAADLEAALRHEHPEVDVDDVAAAVREIVATLVAQGLVDAD